MEYKEFLAILLVLSIFDVEPAGAVEIGSLNQVKSPNILNLSEKTQNMVRGNVIINQCNNNGLNKLKMHSISNNNKKTLKLIVNKVKKHTYHKLSRNSLTANYNKYKQRLHGFSHKVSTKDSIKSTETNVNISIDDKNIKNNETNLNNVTDLNETVFNQTGNETVVNQTNINETTINNINDENKTDFNQTGNETVANGTNINETALNNATDENRTVFNQTNNSTPEDSTKTHVLNTIENVGYAFAAIVGCFAVGAAVAPEGITKTVCVVGAIACGVIAAACFVAYIFTDWFW